MSDTRSSRGRGRSAHGRIWRRIASCALLWGLLTPGSGCWSTSPPEQSWPPLPSNRVLPVTREDLLDLRAKGAPPEAAVMILERDNYIRSLERDGLWQEDEHGN